MSSIADRMKDAMAIRQMKQTDLVRKTGIGKSSISTYLSGDYEPKQRNIYKIALALDVNEAWLMGYDVPMERNDKGAVNAPLPGFDLLPTMKQWPVLGTTACGKPIHEELFDQTVTAPGDIKADVVFRCKGDSMINARIFDGDLVFVRLQPQVERGQIAVVRIGDEYTLKRFYPGDGYVEFRAENPTFPAIFLRGQEAGSENFEVVGLAVAFLSPVK